MEQVMILSDGETYGQLDGCTIANVIHTGLEYEPGDGERSADWWLDEYKAEGREVVLLDDNTIVEIVQRFGPNPQLSK